MRLTLSDNHYKICDKTVSIAKCYVEGMVIGLKKLEAVIGIIVDKLILLSLERSRAIIVYDTSQQSCLWWSFNRSEK